MLPETPQNGEYLVAAYVITTVILMGYWVGLWRRARKLLREKRERGRNSVSGKDTA